MARVVLWWCRVIVDAETSFLAHQEEHRNSIEGQCPEQCPGPRASMESCRSSCDAKSEEQKTPDGSQAGRLCHRLSKESLGEHLVFLGRNASTTNTEGLLPSVTESEPACPEQEVAGSVPIAVLKHATVAHSCMACRCTTVV